MKANIKNILKNYDKIPLKQHERTLGCTLCVFKGSKSGSCNLYGGVPRAESRACTEAVTDKEYIFKLNLSSIFKNL